MFKKLYDRVLVWSAHPRAPAYLAALSAAESSFFPIPPDVMLAPMCLARPLRSWYFATLCTASSVAGGVAGYLIGRLAFGWIEPWLAGSAYAPAFDQAVAAFEAHGFWYILLAGFTPIPYKVFTIASGVFRFDFGLFLAASIVGRSARFFVVAGLIWKYGRPIREFIDRYFNRLSYLFILLLLAGFLILRYAF